MRNINEYDIIWIGHPLLYRYIPSNFRGKIIYDCMDNHEALCDDIVIKNTIHEVEKKLSSDADLIFVSSLGLKKKIERYVIKDEQTKISVIRNGVVFDKIHPPEMKTSSIGHGLKIGYFGTISEWFDFSVIEESLKKFSDIEYFLWGPIAKKNLIENKRVKLRGVIEHHCLWDQIQNMDCLVMPFKISEIIKDVDPVKLYEYISMGKPIISVYYEEIERFRPYVYFYSNPKQYCKILSQMINDELLSKYDVVKQTKFLKDNLWLVRYTEIKNKVVKL